MKSLGVEYLISASAVGSLKTEAKPLDMVVPDQFIDRTKNRVSTFFGEGIVGHITFGDPVCGELAKVLASAIESLNLPDVNLHRGGTYVCMEGPAFSTKAESNLYRSWDATVIGMTNLPEAKLAREAEISYATLALVTDYDCWHTEHDSVTVEMVIANLHRNAENAQKVIQETVRRLTENPPVSDAHSALKYAILTRLDQVPAQLRRKWVCCCRNICKTNREDAKSAKEKLHPFFLFLRVLRVFAVYLILPLLVILSFTIFS